MRIAFNGVYGEIVSMPGCSQVAISHGVFVPSNSRKCGLGKLAQKQRLEFAKKNLGYDYIICTVESTNAAQRHILEKYEWKLLDEFKSTKTDHTVCIYGRKL